MVMHRKIKLIGKISLVIFLLLAIAIFLNFQKTPPLNDDWPLTYSVMPTIQINENLVSIKDIRNFRYDDKERVISQEYYDRIYDLSKLKKVWFLFEPFGSAAHTFLSFEFEDNNFVSISIEAKTNISQKYSAYVGLFRSYPLIYVIADERDSIILRTNVRKNKVNMYPLKITQEQGRLLFLNMVNEANILSLNPKWYNTLTDNCTSLVAKHINSVVSGAISPYSWRLVLTGFSDQLFYDAGLLDIDMPPGEIKKEYDITDISRLVGGVDNYSVLIREKIINN